MEALAVKFSILAGLFGVTGLIGLAALLGSVIWLIIRVANFDSILPAILCVLASVALTAGGLVWSPAPEVVQMEPLKAPWEAPLEALKEQAGKLKEIGPWARFFKDEALPDEEFPEDAPEDAGPADGEGGETQPELETMEVVRTSAPAEGAAASPEEANPAAERSGVLVDEVISGWRVRLILPGEWKDSCIVENDGTYLYFYQKASRQDYGGLVFCLLVAESPVDFDLPEFWHMDGPQIAVEKEGAALISAGPTDVQFNYNAKEISDEYQQMQAEIPGILDTIEFEKA